MINVKDSPYNAVGDGIADDTTALNMAFAVTGQEVELPYGNYKITSNLADPACSQIKGEGQFDTNIVCADGVTKALRFSTATKTHLGSLRDFGVVGNNTANARGIVFGDGDLVSTITVENVFVHGFLGTGAIGVHYRDIIMSHFVNMYVASNTLNEQFEFSVDPDTPGTIDFVSGNCAHSAKRGTNILSGNQIHFKDRTWTHNAEEAIAVTPNTGATMNGIIIEDMWSEENWKSNPVAGNSVLKFDGTLLPHAFTPTIIRGHFPAVQDSPIAMVFTGNMTFNVLDPGVANLANQIVVANGAVGNIALPSYLSDGYESIVSDASDNSRNLRAIRGSFNATPHNLTVTGTASYGSTWTKTDNQVAGLLHIHANTGTTSSTKGTTYFDGFPVPVSVAAVVLCSTADPGIDLPNGIMYASGSRLYTPDWSNQTDVYISFQYMTKH